MPYRQGLIWPVLATAWKIFIDKNLLFIIQNNARFALMFPREIWVHLICSILKLGHY
jgi:hypothetical protein